MRNRLINISGSIYWNRNIRTSTTRTAAQTGVVHKRLNF